MQKVRSVKFLIFVATINFDNEKSVLAYYSNLLKYNVAYAFECLMIFKR